MRVRLLVPFAFLLIPLAASCSRGPSDAELLTRHQQRIEARLRDPSSAQFRQARLYRPKGREGASLACGEVNARNGFGGTTGFQRFISSGDLQLLEAYIGAAVLDSAWQRLCRT